VWTCNPWAGRSLSGLFAHHHPQTPPEGSDEDEMLCRQTLHCTWREFPLTFKGPKWPKMFNLLCNQDLKNGNKWENSVLDKFTISVLPQLAFSLTTSCAGFRWASGWLCVISLLLLIVIILHSDIFCERAVESQSTVQMLRSAASNASAQPSPQSVLHRCCVNTRPVRAC